MNRKITPLHFFPILLTLLLVMSFGVQAVNADVETQDIAATQTAEALADETVTVADTETPEPTGTPVPTSTSTPEVFTRPLVVISSYSSSSGKILPGKTVSVSITVKNQGKGDASNVVISFVSGDLVPRGTGGVIAIPVLTNGETRSFTQDLTAASTVEGKNVAYITATISYTDGEGTSYSSDATLAFNVKPVPTPADGGGYYASATPTSSNRPQLVISGYQTDVNPLQPGTTFQLELRIKNVGTTKAKNITMIMGGGGSSGSGADSGTPAPGGVAGASGEFTNFAPIGASNIQSLGTIPVGEELQAFQKLIVNVSTNPGTYPVKFSYLYTGDDGQQYQDDQVITLLVYRLPLVEVNFYRAVDPLMVGMPGVLPIQIVNLSRSSTILGNMSVSTSAGELMNSSMLVGNLDAGGYFPLDVSITPTTAGNAEITVKLQYTDDFNQPRETEFKLFVDITDAPVMEPMPGEGGMPGEMAPVEPETFWQKTIRFFKGLFGLDSAAPVPETPAPEFDGGGGGGGGGAVPGGKGSLFASNQVS